MRFINKSNDYHNTDLITLKFAFPAIHKKYAYLYSFKASSRTIGRYVYDGHFEETNISINKSNFRPLMERGFDKIYDQIHTVFCIFKDAKTKIYSGLLEVSDYKDHVRLDTLDEYREVLKEFLIERKTMEVDAHFGRYYQSLYYTLLGLTDKKIQAIDIDHPDYRYVYNVVTADDYHERWWDQPKFYTNKEGYNILIDALNNLPSEHSQFWFDFIKKEQQFEALCRAKIPMISKKDHQKFVSSQEKLYIT